MHAAESQGIGFGKLGQPLRVAVTGGAVSPPIDTTLFLAGRARTLDRLDLRERDTVQAIAARYEAHPNQVSAWKRQAGEGLHEVFSQAGSKRGGSTKRRFGTCTRRSAS